MNHQYLTVAFSLMGFVLTNGSVAFAEDATATLPNAKAGECYAKVVIPAQYKTEMQDIVVKEASEKINIIPAKYQWVKEKVLVKEAGKKVMPVAAIYGEKTEKIELSSARKYWATSLKKGASPASSALLDAAVKGGINLKTATRGQCYIESFVPAKYETKNEKVLIKEASQKVEIIPAKYGMVDEKVLIKAASKKSVEIPAIYETITEKVLVEPAKTIWKKGQGLAQRVDNTTGEIMCLVEIPAVYKTVSKRIIKAKATTKIVEIPAEYNVVSVRKLISAPQEKRTNIPEEFTTVSKSIKLSDDVFSWHTAKEKLNATRTGSQICLKQIAATYKTLTKRVVKAPAATKTVAIAAEYKTVRVRKLVTAALENRIKIPAIKQSVSKRIKIGEERLEWRQVLCQTNMTKDVITGIQSALSKKGFNPGPIDGEIGSATLRAVDAYQQKNNLERGGLTIDTIKALGVSS